MDNIFEMLGKLNSNNNSKDTSPIPKEIIDQYPYGQFPLRYTKTGQEIIRKQSESRYSYEQQNNYDESPQENKSDNNLNLSMLLPFIQMLSGGKKNSKDMMQVFSKLLFKDNPDMQKLFSMLPNIKGLDVKTTNNETFPNTNKVEISSLKRID